MSDARSTEAATSDPSEPADTIDTPITGSVKEFDFVDDGNLLVEVEDGVGDLWYETYEFVTAERAKDLRHKTPEADD